MQKFQNNQTGVREIAQKTREQALYVEALSFIRQTIYPLTNHPE